MRIQKLSKSLMMLSMIAPLASCNSNSTGTIVFELNGGHFTVKNFAKELKGISNTAVNVSFPDAAKDGYYFVGWREKRNGSYYEIHKTKLSNGSEAYLYPYGKTTLYAYFEEEKTITFDVGYTDATLVAPKEGATNFNATDKTLKGYVNKSIVEDELPTATHDKSKFQYWYTDYPLKTLKQEEGNVTYYVQDTSKEKGEYKFTSQFGLGRVVFPSYDNGSSFVLHAKWSDNPKVVIDFNVAGVPDYEYQLSNSDEDLTFETVLKKALKESLDTEYSDGKLIYKGKKLNAVCADENLKDKISLNLKIETDTTIYLKWANKITVTFDLDGGTMSADSTLTAYQGDILEEEVYTAHLPTKEGADFRYYTLDGSIYHFGTTALPDTDCTLTAVYDSYPVLTLRYAFPSEFDASSLAISKTYTLKAGTDITTYLNTFKTDFASLNLGDQFKTLSYYTLSSSAEKQDFQGTTMPGSSTTLFLGVGANALVTYKTVDETGKALAVDDVTGYYSDTSRLTDQTFLDENVVSGITYIAVGDVTNQYLFDGLYSDASLDEDYRINEDRTGKTSEDSIPTMTVYRKAYKGIKLSFVDEDGNDLGNCYVIPGDKVKTYSALFASIVGSGKTLSIDGKVLSTILPSSDATVLVK